MNECTRATSYRLGDRRPNETVQRLTFCCLVRVHDLATG